MINDSITGYDSFIVNSKKGLKNYKWLVEFYICR